MSKALWTPFGGVVETKDDHAVNTELSLRGVRDALDTVLREHPKWSSTQSVWAMRCLQMLSDTESEIASVKRNLMKAALEAGVSAPQVAEMAQVSEATARKTKDNAGTPPSVDWGSDDKPLWAVPPEQYESVIASMYAAAGADLPEDRAHSIVNKMFGTVVAEREAAAPQAVAEGPGTTDTPARGEEPSFVDVSLFEKEAEDAVPTPDLAEGGGEDTIPPVYAESPVSVRTEFSENGYVFDLVGAGREASQDAFATPYTGGNLGEMWAVHQDNNRLGTITLDTDRAEHPSWVAKVRRAGKTTVQKDELTFREAVTVLAESADSTE